MIKSFEDLDVYQTSKELFAEVVSLTRTFPSQGKYLATQLNRSANSINANIAEGFGRSIPEFKQYLTRALGSNNETISHLTDAAAAQYGDASRFLQFKDRYTVLGKQIYRLRENWK